MLPGTHPFRDNNPGDMRSGHGSIGRDGGFAIYPSLDAGVNALGATLTGRYADSTISDTIKSFAPGSDGNDPVKCALTLSSAVGVPVSTKISALTPAQLMAFSTTSPSQRGTTPLATLQDIPLRHNSDEAAQVVLPDPACQQRAGANGESDERPSGASYWHFA